MKKFAIIMGLLLLISGVQAHAAKPSTAFDDFIGNFSKPCPKESPYRYYVAFQTTARTSENPVIGNAHVCSRWPAANTTKWFQDFAKDVKPVEGNTLILLNIIRIND